ncbi:auxin-responsive protein IAA13-like protein [Tanacetum coccineum]
MLLNQPRRNRKALLNLNSGGMVVQDNQSPLQKVNLDGAPPNNQSRWVKVKLDGAPLVRRIDLNAYTLYQTVEHSRSLLDPTSDFVLTCEDQDGDCMLVRDLPWQMFLSSVKTLRIMKNSESNELASSFQDNNERHRSDAV